MIRFLHLNYYCHHECSTPAEVLEKHRLSSGFVDILKKQADFISVKHLNHRGAETIDGVPYYFFRSRNRFWYVPFATHRLVKKLRPDVILVEGFVFPLQVLHLRWLLGKHTRILLQHHGERPFPVVKRMLQQWADDAVDAYTFTTLGNAADWLQKKIIRNSNKCHEVLSASTAFVPREKNAAKQKLGLSGDWNFLWVARLNANKDPLLVVRSFIRYRETNPDARLYLIYQTTDLLEELKQLVAQHPGAAQHIFFLGEKKHEELANWFSAADFYISGSHKEGSGYALVEAMCCGCIPVVSDIPPFRKITGDGACGVLFEKGNEADLLDKLKGLPYLDRQALSEAAMRYNREQHSYEAIATQFYNLSKKLMGKQLHDAVH